VPALFAYDNRQVESPLDSAHLKVGSERYQEAAEQLSLGVQQQVPGFAPGSKDPKLHVPLEHGKLLSRLEEQDTEASYKGLLLS
jgi:hypothetical protein